MNDEKKIMLSLKPQICQVLEGMQNAVRAEEEHRLEMKRLKEEEIARRQQDLQKAKEKLRKSGRCPAGFTWHRSGNDGWRCAGGSHFVSDAQLNQL